MTLGQGATTLVISRGVKAKIIKFIITHQLNYGIEVCWGLGESHGDDEQKINQTHVMSSGPAVTRQNPISKSQEEKRKIQSRQREDNPRSQVRDGGEGGERQIKILKLSKIDYI